VKEKQCYFCEAQNVNGSLYVGDFVDGKYVPMQVPVCKECKKEYEATFPKQ
jgi:hypothetical protein